MDEYKEFQQQKTEFEQKGRARKTHSDITDPKGLSPNKPPIDDSRNLSPNPPGKSPAHSSMKPSASCGSSDFERADESDDILESHINRNEREQIQNLLNQIQKYGQEEEQEEVKKTTHIEDQESSDMEREDIEDSVDSGRYHKVKPVTKDQIVPQARKILQVCVEQDVDIMEVQNMIFDDFSLTSKISVRNLAILLQKKFDFGPNEATLLARFMVEQTHDHKTESGVNESDTMYRYDPDAQLSHAKVVSRLQSVMSALMAQG